jgi:hypothetical protein
MTPDFDELVGTDLEPAERERLKHVHELLITAGPPPDLVEPKVVHLASRRRRGVLLALAAAIAVTAFALGASLVGQGDEGGPFEVSMKGVGAFEGASATLTVFRVDDAGNWPMKLEARDLQPLERPFELWLTRDGSLLALCGTFRTSQDGSAVVPLNAPYRIKDFDGWIVVEEGSTGVILANTV